VKENLMTDFKGTIGRTLAESEPHFVELPHPGDDSPNVVIVLLDDTGFAQLGCYGSDIDTPNIDALAGDGVQFTNFHVTPLCSPTRAALLTGRRVHHSDNTARQLTTRDVSPSSTSVRELVPTCVPRPTRNCRVSRKKR